MRKLTKKEKNKLLGLACEHYMMNNFMRDMYPTIPWYTKIKDRTKLVKIYRKINKHIKYWDKWHNEIMEKIEKAKSGSL